MLSQLKLSTLFLCAATALAETIGPVATITLANKDISPDGFTRSASLINGAHPGPVITANKGDQIKINVVNQLSDPNQERGATIHWHGIFQKGTNFMDGVDGVTQCPIAPNNSFQYAFNVDQSGTYWYHSHFGVQYCDGVRGVLIVNDPSDPLKHLYDVDNESTIITLSEWYHEVAASQLGTIESADSTLINGKGRFPGGDSVDLAVVNVERGKRYRLRLVSISCSPDFMFSIDNHDLTVIEVEGTAVQPYTINTIHIFAGQRYSVVLNANQTIGNYWIRALPNTGNRNLNSTFANGVNSAILRYQGAPSADPASSQQLKQIPLIEAELRPNPSISAPGERQPNGTDATFNLALDFDPNAFLFTINGTSFKSPSVPVLLQILSGAHTAQDLLPAGSIYTVERNKTVQITFNSGVVGGPHPFHMHGHAFSVVRSADTGNFNYDNPIVRDVVSIGNTPGDFVAIRFRTDNPGPWILHCHIDFHLAEGLAIVFAEAPNDIASANPNPPADWKELCPIWDNEPADVKVVNNTTST
ncbi:multicopper oxidase [Macrolepiota fuliginosa MF-IS2]|uniref:Multicopper oxidase n=1 Tax=Macrolepiota fuliginosa MF-IS2 TaxID=1400762 RepID=A0A9P5X714_9AGAR|nr:multicopper oxidase [Macrolepiota fuliginosa MF-IS2]